MGVPEQILKGVGIGGEIAGGIVQARGARAAGEAEALASERNARLALLEGRQKAAYLRRTGSAELTAARVRMGAGGVRLEGTPLDFLANRAREIEREATDAEIAARNTASLDRGRARGARAAGKTGAGTALLMGGTRAAQTAYRFWGT